MANKAALVLLLVISLAGKTSCVCLRKKQRLYSTANFDTTALMTFYAGCLSLVERVTFRSGVRPSVCPFFSDVNRVRGATHTQRDSHKMRTCCNKINVYCIILF